MTLSPALAQAMASARPALNATVAAARAARPGFDTGALGVAVRDRLDPVVAAVASVAPHRVDAVAVAGFGMIVALIGQRLIGPGARDGAVDRLWTDVAPAYAGLIATSPATILGGLTNAATRIAATRGARVDDWLAAMRRLAPLVDADTLRPAGQVAAWRAGMAHYRDGALHAADTLPEPLALAAVGATGRWVDVRDRLAANRWWSPGAGSDGIVFGGYTGLGGPFAEPPLLAAGADGFLVRSGEDHGLLIVDACGATLHPATAAEFNAAASAPVTRPTIERDGVRTADRIIPLDLPPTGLTIATTPDSIAIASAFSHFVTVHPWRRP